jgi:hypothetical protein
MMELRARWANGEPCSPIFRLPSPSKQIGVTKCIQEQERVRVRARGTPQFLAISSRTRPPAPQGERLGAEAPSLRADQAPRRAAGLVGRIARSETISRLPTAGDCLESG